MALEPFRYSPRKNRTLAIDYPPRIIIKFRQGLKVSEALQYDYLPYLKLEEVNQFRNTFPSLEVKRLFASVKPDNSGIHELTRKLKERNRDATQLLNLLTYFTIICPKEIKPRDVIELLKTFSAVEKAYIAPDPETPAVNPGRNLRWPRAEAAFLKSAPGGIDVEYAWEIENSLNIRGGDGAGAGLTFVDIEHGWAIADGAQFPNNHGDIAKLIGIDGVNVPPYYHGTASLGIVIASDAEPAAGTRYENSLLGITPNVENVACVSTCRNQGEPTPNLYDAIWYAITWRLSAGDVLLLEQYWYHWPKENPTHFGVPIEIDDDCYNLIKFSTDDLGIVVIEPAGNTDRDNDMDTFGIPRLTRGGAEDSGAIIVSAAHSSVLPALPAVVKNPNAPIVIAGIRAHCYGGRVDCFAWGEDIFTTWHHPGDPAYAYFGDTSGASAIIAGAALSVQCLASINLGAKFDPIALRSILANSDPCTGGGTLSFGHPNDKIGVMPNLRNILRRRLRLVPDVYVRDNINDIGDCHAGPLSLSPDIILRRLPVLNPQATFGQGSGTENDVNLSDSAIVGQPHTIYVRVRNRGPVAEANVQADVYWSQVSTLPDPNNWQLIGNAVFPNVPPGDSLTISPPIAWAAAPNPGHYCFITVLGTGGDPPPAPRDFGTWANFQRYIREENNVAWRNFDVIGINGAAAQVLELDFLIEGPPDQARNMRLEIVSALPDGSDLRLIVPQNSQDLLRGLGNFELLNKEGKALAIIPLNPRGLSRSQYRDFPRRLSLESRLQLNLPALPAEGDGNPYELFVRQLCEDREVGRVTWRLAPN
jgi:serine protease